MLNATRTITLFGTAIAATVFAVPPARAQLQPCPELQGIERLVYAEKARFIFFGELHGTAEIPELFGDAVCHLSAGRPVTVAFEMSSRHQESVKMYLESQGAPADVEALLKSDIWNPSWVDGRSSKAMLALMERLRKMRSDGARLDVALFQPSGSARLHQDYYELSMAYNLARLADQAPDNLIAVLVGSVHAAKAPSALTRDLTPAASHLPKEDVISLRFENGGGSAWNCRASGCGPSSLPVTRPTPRRVTVLTSSADAFDGTFSVGAPTTASPPASEARGDRVEPLTPGLPQ